MWVRLHSENRCALKSGKEKPTFLWSTDEGVTCYSTSLLLYRVRATLGCSELALTADPQVNPANLVSAMGQIFSQSRPSFGHGGCPLSRDRGLTVLSKLQTQTTGLGEMRFFFSFFSPVSCVMSNSRVYSGVLCRAQSTLYGVF